MAPVQDDYETPRWRTLWLGLGFIALVAIGVVTVLLPSLEDEPQEESGSSQEEVGEQDESDDTVPQ